MEDTKFTEYEMEVIRNMRSSGEEDEANDSIYSAAYIFEIEGPNTGW
jgi:hypothetical protein